MDHARKKPACGVHLEGFVGEIELLVEIIFAKNSFRGFGECA
jgi:hypothetical protein